MSRIFNKPGWRVLLVAGVLTGIGPLSAAPILELDFLATPDTSTESTGVRGRLTFSFSEDAGVDYLTLTIANTTPISIGSRLTAVGLELPGELTGLPVFAPGGTSAYFTRLDYSIRANPPWMNAPGGYDLMLTSNGNFEGGNPNGAPSAGESQTVVLSLGATPYGPQQWADLFRDFYKQTTDPFAIARFQSVGPDGEASDKVLGVSIPEPSSSLLALAASLCLHPLRFCKEFKPSP